MKFHLVLLLLIPIITASDEPEESHEEIRGGDELQKAFKETVKGNTEFAINLFRHVTSVSSQSNNVVLSSLGISSAFSMLSLGARKKTHQEIWEGLRLDNTHFDEKDVHQSYSNLLQMLNEPRSSLQLDVGNAVFLEDTLTLLKSFEDDVQHYYHAEIRKTDFTDSQGAITKINKYVKNKTEGKIEELLQELHPRTKMVLISYVLFKDNTRVGKFFLDGDTTVDVQMMHRTGLYNTFYDTELPCTVVELPYKDNASMIIAIAKPGKIHEVEQGLTAETIQRWKTSFIKMNIEFSLPKTSVSSTINLEDVLEKLGIKTAFTNLADFSGITHDECLKVWKAVHKTVLRMDEKGTVAAGATAVEMIPVSVPMPISIDHPFVSIISDQNTNSILFMATIMNPTQN